MIVAAAQAADAFVLITVAFGAALGVMGLASFDPRLRSRLPIAALANGNAAMSIGLVAASIVVVGIALGFAG